MKNFRFLLSLLMFSSLFTYGQEEKKADISSANSPLTDVAAMVKQVLGEVYVDVGHIPEPQWFEMEPVAEEYVRALFKARAMPDDEAATQLVRQAWEKYEVAIDASLTPEQKAARTQKRAELATWKQRLDEQFLQAKDSLLREAKMKKEAKIYIPD